MSEYLEVAEEILRYDLGSLAADVGGFLGLLLGASLLSLYDTLVQIFLNRTSFRAKAASPIRNS